MSPLKSGILLLALCLSLAACGSSNPLKIDEIPPDFVFSFERKVTGEVITPAREPVGSEPVEEPPAEGEPVEGAPGEVEPMEGEPAEGEPAEGEPMEGEPAEGEPAEAEPAEDEPAADEPAEGESAVDEPAVDEPAVDEPAEGELPVDAEGRPVTPEGVEATSIYLEIKFPGRVVYELEFLDPVPASKEGTIELSDEAFKEIYLAVREADLFNMEKRYVGDEPTGRREVFVVKGNLRFARVEVEGMTVPRLDKLFETIRATLRAKQAGVFGPPKGRTAVYIMNRPTGEFHRADCPRIDEIPEKERMDFPNPERCLDAGGEPCETCRPLKKEEES